MGPAIFAREHTALKDRLGYVVPTAPESQISEKVHVHVQITVKEMVEDIVKAAQSYELHGNLERIDDTNSPEPSAAIYIKRRCSVVCCGGSAGTPNRTDTSPNSRDSARRAWFCFGHATRVTKLATALR